MGVLEGAGPLADASPTRRWVLGIGVPYLAAYGVAGLVGVSRIVDQQHWLTDVVTGAVVGITVVGLLTAVQATRPASSTTSAARTPAAGMEPASAPARAPRTAARVRSARAATARRPRRRAVSRRWAISSSETPKTIDT